MNYAWIAIPESAIPHAANPVFQHLLDTYVSETNKVASTWKEFQDSDLDYKPPEKSTNVGGIFKHQLLSERRFFGEFLHTPEPAPEAVLPSSFTVDSAVNRFVELATARLEFFAQRQEPWWMEVVPFFDVERQRIWIFWRRVLHTAHHRTQLTVFLRMMGRNVPSTYGPTADVTWTGADPTNTVEAAGRR
ncbi:DinB family protein [Acidicapsa acidisoli]|uniref:DinB family protein n=1 Tax=Acidicapsa acidisoli TaxID=1615681 RepID=UPI0021E01462|nr:DinB family protein [Acidicapsa acidisoli]